MADRNDHSQNVSIHNETSDQPVTTSTDGAKERLDVQIKNDENLDIALSTIKKSVVSTLNSTSTPLGSGATYTGTFENIEDYSNIAIIINTDQDSITDGLVIEWSVDGINVHADDKFSLFANEQKIYTFGAVAKYFRINYTNDVNAQSSFLISTLLKPFDIKASSHRVQNDIDKNDDAELVKSIITGQVGNTNQFVNVSVTTEGQLQVNVIPSAASKTLQLSFDQNHSAPNKYEWQEVLEYIVPTGFDLNAVTFDALSAVSNESARVVSKELHGSFDTSTGIYTDTGDLWTLPKFGSKMYVYVTSAIGSINDDIITITYVNQDGVSGRTANVTIPKTSLVGTRLRVSLQTGDYGVLDVTNVTHTVTQAGNIQISSIIELFYLTMTTQLIQYQSSAVSLGGIVVPEGDKIFLQYKSNSQVSNLRRISLVATLLERI